MEAAADKIRSVVKNLLPERPHHLSLYPDRKYPVPPNFWHHQSPLQYSTFLSDADRGILLTRPYFDICDEPDLATTRPPIRPGPKKIMNKMSFQDYHKRQKEKASTSPTENGVPGKPDTHRRDVAVALEKDGLRKDLERPGTQRDNKAQESRMNGDSDRSRNPSSRPIARDATSPSDSKKRPLEADDGVRQHKKAKPSESLPNKLLRPETPRSREHSSGHDRSLGKEGRSGASQLTPGSRPAQGNSREKDRMGSPRTTANGAKSSNSLPRKPDTPSKHSVPPLLSPLRHPAIDDELETSSPRKRPKEPPTINKTQKVPPKSEVTAKKQKLPLPDLPSLLSPTLPPMVEDELERVDKVLHQVESSQAAGQTPETSKRARKAQIQEIVAEGSEPKRFLVTLKIKKSQRRTVKSLLALPTKVRKEASVSLEDTPPPAKKRPRAADSSIEAAPTIAAKRAKVAETSTSKAPAPYTPPNPPAVTSVPGSTQMQTPRGPVTSTPTTTEAARAALSKELSKRRDLMISQGRNLKRERDKAKRADQAKPNGAPPSGAKMTGDDYRRAMLTMEMVLAFFIAFHSSDHLNAIGKKPADVRSWVSLEAHLGELKYMSHRSPPMAALTAQLQGILVNEILRTCSTLGSFAAILALDEEAPKDTLTLQKVFLRNTERLHLVWTEVEKLRNKVTDERLKTPVMGPWTSPYKAAADTLIAMSRIAEREHVNWRAEVSAPKE